VIAKIVDNAEETGHGAVGTKLTRAGEAAEAMEETGNQRPFKEAEMQPAGVFIRCAVAQRSGFIQGHTWVSKPASVRLRSTAQTNVTRSRTANAGTWKALNFNRA
jgi:hypothetical protein